MCVCVYGEGGLNNKKGRGWYLTNVLPIIPYIVVSRRKYFLSISHVSNRMAVGYRLYTYEDFG
jgi:hypothetical protein